MARIWVKKDATGILTGAPEDDLKMVLVHFLQGKKYPTISFRPLDRW
jgi:hypothetical protein